MATRLHAYHLGCIGTTYSYATDGYFMLVGTHYNAVSKPAILRELRLFGKDSISILVVPEWVDRYCSSRDIRNLLTELKPTTIIIPPSFTANGTTQLVSIAIRSYCSLNPFAHLIEVKPLIGDKFDYSKAGNSGIAVFSPRSYAINLRSLCMMLRKGTLGVLLSGESIGLDVSSKIRNTFQALREMDVIVTNTALSDNEILKDTFLQSARPRIIVDCSEGLLETSKTYIGTIVLNTKINDVVVAVNQPPFGVAYYLTKARTVINKQTFVVKKRS